ncbi:hypothetical protein TW84_00370 [Vibrio neptunius]|uniref:hypothetical protein n=1 Tax=Vibrio neptunius TaxID=170651 RepID=UPI0005FA288B|nr:hypothetical protein [Vibrio neptunius]KJY94141.1 hypothetical protein TW84_00370 [Vibrio neptunius]
MPTEISAQRLANLSYLDLEMPKSTSKLEARKFDISQVPLKDQMNTVNHLDLAVTPAQSHYLSTHKTSTTESKQLIENSTRLYDQAQKAGVDVAKSTFFKELFNVAIAGIGLGLAIAATVFSGGLGVPLVAAAGVAFALAVSDAGCAAANWYSKAHGGEGLKMGADTISNLTYKLLEKMGMSDDRAQYWAKANSALLRLGLTIGTLYAGTVSVPSALGAAGSVISTTKLAKLGVGAAGDKALGFSLDNNKKVQEKADSELRAHKQKLKSQLTDEVMSVAMSMRTADMSTKLSGLSKKVSGLSDELSSAKQVRNELTHEIQGKDEQLHLASEKAKQQEQSQAILLAAQNAAKLREAMLREELAKKDQLLNDLKLKLEAFMNSGGAGEDVKKLSPVIV